MEYKSGKMLNRLKNQFLYFFCAVNLIGYSEQLMAQEIADKRWNPVLDTNEYVNPVIPGFFPDPSVVRVGEDYYCINSTFEYFPGIIISHSKDLINWKQIGHVFTKSEEFDLTKYWDGMGVWAPDISFYHGEFYVFYCMVQLKKDRSYNVRGNYMVKSKSIFGPWSKPVQITDHGNDPSHFVDLNGDHYMLYAAGIPQGYGTKIVKLNNEATSIVEGPYWIETEGKKAAPEGPHLLYKSGYYYLTMAASGGLFNGHHMLVARSKNVLGPYMNSPYNPLLTQKNAAGINFHQGHGKLFQTQSDEWFTMVLSQRWLPSTSTEKRYQKGVSQLGRETSLIRLNWTKDGWPVDEPSRQALDIAIIPKLKEAKVVNYYWDEFNKPMLNIPWQFRRNPLYANLSLTKKKGNLRLYSGDYDIDTLLGRNLILQRERWLKYTATTKISFEPKTTEQAGLTCYYDTQTYARLGWQKGKMGGWELSFEEMKYGRPVISKVTSIRKVSHLFLRLRVDKLTRLFEYSYDNKHWLSAGEILDASYLSDQGTPNWGFMGMMVGIYSFNRGSGNKIPADFDWFKISDYK